MMVEVGNLPSDMAGNHILKFLESVWRWGGTGALSCMYRKVRSWDFVEHEQ
jgi:hypothetical protein